MKRLDWFEAGYAKKGMELGIVSTSLYGYYIAYCVYTEYRNDNHPHMQAVRLTAEETEMSESNVLKAVYFFVNSPEV